jgi:hypothetical protein
LTGKDCASVLGTPVAVGRGKFRATAQARAKARSFCLGSDRKKMAMLLFWCFYTADWPAVDACAADPDKKMAIKSSIFCTNGLITNFWV